MEEILINHPGFAIIFYVAVWFIIVALIRNNWPKFRRK